MEDETMTFSVVTTFHKAGYEKYGRRMIQTFLQNWPSTVQLHVYAEDCEVSEKADNLFVHSLHEASPELVEFKNKWKDVPKANGREPIPPVISGAKKQPGLGFKWDAVRFSHKVYAIFHCAKICNTNALLWMDADSVCHSPITLQELEKFCPGNIDLAFLGREGKYTECGLYYMNLKSEAVKTFLKRFQWMYDDAENGMFKQSEWHDSFIFDVVRKHTVLQELNWSAGLIRGEGHPLVNSAWGKYLDHLKGDRKDLGRSKSTDLKIQRTESYWN